MTTQKQIEANRMNSQRSTGPRTEERKRASSMNALKSGLDAESQFVLGESPPASGAAKENAKRRSSPPKRTRATRAPQYAAAVRTGGRTFHKPTRTNQAGNPANSFPQSDRAQSGQRSEPLHSPNPQPPIPDPCHKYAYVSNDRSLNAGPRSEARR